MLVPRVELRTLWLTARCLYYWAVSPSLGHCGIGSPSLKEWAEWLHLAVTQNKLRQVHTSCVFGYQVCPWSSDLLWMSELSNTRNIITKYNPGKPYLVTSMSLMFSTNVRARLLIPYNSSKKPYNEKQGETCTFWVDQLLGSSASYQKFGEIHYVQRHKSADLFTSDKH